MPGLSVAGCLYTGKKGENDNTASLGNEQRKGKIHSINTVG
ncbi:hypothetical protein XNC1_2937 [Xenorhabdus nematophila ATCC 19061]|uniref:Uncharacterized protein n=1 Tax=Xenorhabdus nematophila (strain ATCC 19061 / DSM 3370 / CCUG 14189 / LMG 1036 / NCIMB 9965 / AN6) TaxID=406817 RepID=D3VJT2_XENNA|nr:hypothetical protein XNC1_2937 [Xenorhabdus nematophila ATCC 19061]